MAAFALGGRAAFDTAGVGAMIVRGGEAEVIGVEIEAEEEAVWPVETATVGVGVRADVAAGTVPGVSPMPATPATCTPARDFSSPVWRTRSTHCRNDFSMSSS